MSINVALPEYASNADRFILVRLFSNALFRESFLAGKMRMGVHSDYSRKEYGEGITDPNEGVTFVVHQTRDDTYPSFDIVRDDVGNYYFRAYQHALNRLTIQVPIWPYSIKMLKKETFSV